MQLLNGMDGVRIFTVCRGTNHEWALERLFTRIHRTMQTWDSYAAMIFDEGKEAEITKLLRKMGVYNPVPVYVASGITEIRNLAVERIIEDPVFKPSDRSYFIQMADFVAYALLRREQRLPSKDKYRIHECFDLLSDAVERKVSPRDPMGVIR